MSTFLVSASFSYDYGGKLHSSILEFLELDSLSLPVCRGRRLRDTT